MATLPDSSHAAVYDVTAELDEGVEIRSGKAWRGYRIRYRREGETGRWRSFLLTADEPPDGEQLQRICAYHEAETKGSR